MKEYSVIMDRQDFVEFACGAARRLKQFIQPPVSNTGNLGHLICPINEHTDEMTLREPEIRTAFILQAEKQELYYGIEWRTKNEYSFTGETPRKALTDFALLQEGAAKAIVVLQI